MFTRIALAALTALASLTVLSGCASTRDAVPAETAPVAAVPWQRVHLGEGASGYDFPVYANHPMDGDMRAIRQVVLVQHGLQRDGDRYYAAGAKLLAESGVPSEQVLLIAPNFPGTPDKAKGFDKMPVWSVQGWIGGEDAVNPPFRVSSLQVFDDLIRAVTDKTRFPNLQRVTVAGHSGGGQIVHRYAALNNVDESIRQRGVDLRYVVANPSSYLYFTNERPQGDGFVPYDAAVCPGYNNYRYGMDDMVPYARGADGKTLFQRYAQRQVTYLLGTADNDPNHRVLDKSCGAEAEGPTRLQRGRAYLRYERHLAGPQGRIAHRAYEVVDVGHDQSKMFGSRCGALAVFGMPEAANPGGAACRAPQP